jgi:hypothetical protein
MEAKGHCPSIGIPALNAAGWRRLTVAVHGV